MKKIAIVTGATGGLGKAFVMQLTGEVEEIWAIGRNREKLKKLEAEGNGEISGMSVDLSDIGNLEVVRERLESGDYEVAWLVNNAGTGRMAASTDFSAQEINSHICTHNTAVAVLCNICIPYMKKGSHIINVASQSAFQPVAYINLYAASKAFCLSYSRALNLELKNSGIGVTAVCPGWIRTELLQTEMNGHKVEFPHLAEADEVVKKAVKDAKKNKDMSVYGAYVKRMQFYSKVFSHKTIMNLWYKSIKKYIEPSEAKEKQ